MTTTKQMLLSAPDSQLDHCIFPLIETFDDEPTAEQLLHLLDECVYGALSSGAVIMILEILLDTALTKEGIKYEEVVAKAHWRNREK